MNQAVKEALAIIVRQMLIAAGTALGMTDTLDPYLGPLTTQIVAILIVAGAGAWAQIVQRFKRLKLMQSLAYPGTTSEAKIESMVRDTGIHTPPISTSKHSVPV